MLDDSEAIRRRRRKRKHYIVFNGCLGGLGILLINLGLR
jgi:hypothetical protein